MSFPTGRCQQDLNCRWGGSIKFWLRTVAIPLGSEPKNYPPELDKSLIAPKTIPNYPPYKLLTPPKTHH